MKTEDALSLKIQCDLSDEQYQIIRNSSIIYNADIYPSLHEIKNERHHGLLYNTAGFVALNAKN